LLGIVERLEISGTDIGYCQRLSEITSNSKISTPIWRLLQKKKIVCE
jgi:hypothetical protein